MQKENTHFVWKSNIVINNLGLWYITYLKYKIIKMMQKYYGIVFPEILMLYIILNNWLNMISL